MITKIAIVPAMPNGPAIGRASPISGVGGMAASRLSVNTIAKATASARTGRSSTSSARKITAPYT